MTEKSAIDRYQGKGEIQGFIDTKVRKKRPVHGLIYGVYCY